MLTIYVKDLNLADLAKLQNLLDDAVTLYPLTDRLIALKCEGAIRAYLAEMAAPAVEISQTHLECLTLKEQSVLELLGTGSPTARLESNWRSARRRWKSTSAGYYASCT